METEEMPTVQKEVKLKIKKPRDPRPSRWLSFFKWLFAVFLFISVLACVVTSKISLLAIGVYYNETRLRVKTNESHNPSAKETTFIMMVLILMIPQFLSFLKTCLVAGLIEVASLSFFLVVIVLKSSVTALHCILIMNALFLFPILWQLYKLYSLRPRIFLVVALVLEIVGISLVTYDVVKAENKLEFAGIAAALLLLSFAWCPEIQKRQIKSRNETQGNVGTVSWNDPSESTSNTTGTPEPSTENPNQNTDDCVKEFGIVRNARGKSTFIASLWKLLLTPFVAAFFCYFFDVADLHPSSLRGGFENFDRGHAKYHFVAQIITSLVGYILGRLACSMCLQRVAFALPLTLATPVALALIHIPSICSTSFIPFTCNQGNDYWIIPIAIGLWIAQFLSTEFYVWKRQTFIMAKESSLFWLPSYNGAFLEQNLLLSRKNQITDKYQLHQREIAQNSRIYICTTMYHETENEMEQLLHSLHDVDLARRASQRRFEAHIFFDEAVKKEVLNDFALQLIGLLPKTLNVEIDDAKKIKTPYGMQLRWKLPGGMPFVIHLKDNLKVKNKKRWSQIMYMSYVLDYKVSKESSTDDNTYILATDADVKFTHESVQALLALIIRDPRVGAVCGRTHPLGSGPIVWYQVFDYAIGHWFQKVANHVLGSVLCSPGCFSVYRANAIRNVLPSYATKVNTTMEFLTKDMGEDRWLCTLMVQSGWHLEYCAAAECSTYCPDKFDEFFKQRRRWIPSTLANLIQLIGEWKTTTEKNDKISIFFIFYQALMVFSTLISPGTVILVITGALSYIVDGLIVTLVLLVLVTVGFACVCLCTKQDFQLKVAKLLTIVFALLMAFVSIGMAVRIGTDLHKRSTCGPNGSSTTGTLCPDDLPADLSTLYVAGLVGIFLIAACLHPSEWYCIFYGVWYLFCLPSGYLLVIIYSVCNLTNRSWGTRETKEKKSEDEVSWYTQIWNKLKCLCMCCRPHASESPSQSAAESEEEGTSSEEEVASDSDFSDEESPSSQDNKAYLTEDTSDNGAESLGPFSLSVLPKSATNSIKLKRQISQDKVEETDVEDWLEPKQKESVEEWLYKLGLKNYYPNFNDYGFNNPSVLEDLQAMDSKTLRETLKEDLQITKAAHVTKMIKAIKNLHYLTPAQREFRLSREKINKIKRQSLQEINKDEGIEYDFWERLREACLFPDETKLKEKHLREACLLPESAISVTERKEIPKEKLKELRDSALLVFAIANAIWIILLVTLDKQINRKVLGTNAIGFALLAIYGFLLVIQFLSLIWYRMNTICHMLARAPWRKGPYQTYWSFRDADLPPETMNETTSSEPPPDSTSINNTGQRSRQTPVADVV